MIDISKRFKEGSKLENTINENYKLILEMINNGIDNKKIIVSTPKGALALGDKITIMSLVCNLVNTLLNDKHINNEDIDILIGVINKIKEEE